MKTAQPNDFKTEALPAERATIRLSRRFSPEEMERIRRGFTPMAQEDKWFVYWNSDALFFHRSWTGYCIYVVRFAVDGESHAMFEAEVNRDPEQYTETSDERDAALISYLIDVLLLQRAARFPTDADSPELGALEAWSQVGRAMFDPKSDDA